MKRLNRKPRAIRPEEPQHEYLSTGGYDVVVTRRNGVFVFVVKMDMGDVWYTSHAITGIILTAPPVASMLIKMVNALAKMEQL